MVTKNGKVVTLRKAIPPINSHKHVFTWGDMTNQKQNISIIPMFTRHTKVVTYFEELLPIFLHEKIDFCMKNLKNFYFQFHKTYGY